MTLENKILVKPWLKRQRQRGRGYRVILAILACVDTCFGVSLAAVIAESLTMVLSNKFGGMTMLLYSFAAVTVVRVGLNFLREDLAVRCSASARQNLRKDVMSAIDVEGPHLLRRFHSAEIAAMVVDHVDAMDGFFARYLTIKATWLLTPSIVLLAVYYENHTAALILLSSALLAVIAQAVFGIWTGVEAKRQFRAMLRLQTRFLDRVRGIATLVLSGAVSNEVAQLHIVGDALRQKTMRVLRTAFLSSTATDMAAVIALVGLALTSFRQVSTMSNWTADGGSQLFSIFFAFICVPEFYSSFRAKGVAYQDAAQAEAAAGVLCQLEEVSRKSGVEAPLEMRDVRLTFDDVTFSWRPDRKPAVCDLSFTVGIDDILVLDGPSGAGKSTIMELILGFKKPQQGKILFNDIDATCLSHQARARSLAWIDQKPVIFAGTLRQNILFGNPSASTTALDNAVEQSGLNSIMHLLPNALDTVMGEGGYGLSGGQVQRVAIARAFLKDAPMILLDEPTAHLDPESERGIVEAIRCLARGRTVILSSHASSVRALATKTVLLRDPRSISVKSVAAERPNS